MGARLGPLTASAVDDESVGEIVRRNSNANSIPRKDSDVMAPHAPGELSSYDGPALIHFDRVLTATQRVFDHAFHL